MYAWSGDRPPFAAATRHMVTRTLACLRSEVPGGTIAVGVWRDLDRDLERLIGAVTLPYLFAELKAFQLSGRGSRASGADALGAFLSSLGQVDLERVPRLHALVESSVGAWREGVVTMMRRLQDDLPNLHGTLLPTSAQQVIEVSRSLSEPILGHSVRRISFDDGSHVVYKPRSVGPEETWARLVERINGLSAAPKLQAARALGTGTYGWCEHVSRRELASAASAHDYYSRVGELLCWLRTFGTMDVVRSNLIAAGSSPVFVDCETIFYPRPSNRDRVEPDRSDGFKVTDTGMLPLPQPVAGGGETYTSAISIREPQTTTAMACMLSPTGLSFQRTTIPAPGPECVPILDGFAVEATGYVDDIKEGFTSAYYLTMRRRRQVRRTVAEVLSDSSIRVRYACRPTVVYTELLHRVVLATSGFFEMSRVRDLFRSLPLRGGVEDTDALLDQEWECLRGCATPRFTVEAAGAMDLQPGSIRLETHESGVTAALERLKALDDEDLATQLALIDETLGMSPDRRG